MKWSWITGPLSYSDKCVLCAQPLKRSPSVEWVDAQRYHLTCLLDHLSLEATQSIPPLHPWLTGLNP